jgi:hypothetical protein
MINSVQDRLTLGASPLDGPANRRVVAQEQSLFSRNLYIIADSSPITQLVMVIRLQRDISRTRGGPYWGRNRPIFRIG